MKKYRFVIPIIFLCALFFFFSFHPIAVFFFQPAKQEEKNYIRWVDFQVPYEALNLAYQADLASQKQDPKICWIDLLGAIAAQYGGTFSSKSLQSMAQLITDIQEKKTTISQYTAHLKYYPYYKEAYTAVLGGMVGPYQTGIVDKENPKKIIWKTTYGLKAFSPIAKNYPYYDYDDFGVSRSYGYRRQHLGHDMMGQTGTPIIAVESGYIEALGWNQYGGWRIGIRSFDQKRYYYYAHLRQNFPYQKSLKEGDIVQAGDVIGYLGHTGYSKTENTNNIDTPHLHFGLQLIFDPSQKEGPHEIWIDCYALVRFLAQHRCETVKNLETKEYHRTDYFRDPSVPSKRSQKSQLDNPSFTSNVPCS